MASLARNRHAGREPCRSGRRYARTAGRATARWWSVIWTWRSVWRAWSMKHLILSGWPTYRSASSVCVIDQPVSMIKSA